MTAAKNEAVARRYVEMWDNQKWKWDQKATWDEFLDVWHKDILLHFAGEEVHGIAALQEAFSPVFEAFPDFRGTVDQIFSARDMVALLVGYSFQRVCWNPSIGAACDRDRNSYLPDHRRTNS